MFKSLFIAAAFATVASTAAADIEVRFVEGAPKDRFDIINTGGCALGPVAITIDLAGSSAGLVFDVTASGAGVEVFQPFDLVAGRELVNGLPQVVDGDQQVSLNLTELGVDQMVSFTIDVDDTAGNREITVSDAEISGASVRVKQGTETVTGTFDDQAFARVAQASCSS